VVRRKGYSANGTTSLFPLNAELNLPQDKYVFGAVPLGSARVADSSFDEVAQSIGRTTGSKVPKRQVIELMVKMSQDFDAFYRLSGEAEKTSDLLVISKSHGIC
jgi:hypothetical protein